MQYAILKQNNAKFKSLQSVYDNDGNLNIFLPTFKEKNAIKYAYRVNEILEDARINEVLMDKHLLACRKFCNFLLDYDRYIITGRRMYKAIVPRILNDVSKLMRIDIQKLKVALLINNYSVENVDLINSVAEKVKSLTVVTTDKDYYEQVKKDLYDKKGIVLKTLEKYRMNLKYVNVIINVDFPGYDLDSINYSNNTLFICGLVKYYGEKKNFNGIIIRNIDIISSKKVIEDIDEFALSEADNYVSFRKLHDNDNNFNNAGYRINGFFGENGKITSEEFQKLGKIILDK